MRTFFLYVIGLIPGLVQAHLNAPIIGSCYFVLFLFSLNAYVMSSYWFMDERLQMVGRLISSMFCLLIWLYAYRDLHLRLQNQSVSDDSVNHSGSSQEQSDNQ